MTLIRMDAEKLKRLRALLGDALVDEMLARSERIEEKAMEMNVRYKVLPTDQKANDQRLVQLIDLLGAMPPDAADKALDAALAAVQGVVQQTAGATQQATQKTTAQSWDATIDNWFGALGVPRNRRSSRSPRAARVLPSH